MTSSQAQNAVLASAAVTAGVIVYDTVKKGARADLKTVSAGAVVFAALALGASAAPNVAGPLAILLGLAVAYSKIGALKGGAK